MRVLVIGAGGREHALADALARSRLRPRVFVGPGNPGIGREYDRVPLSPTDVNGAVSAAAGFDLVVIGPEAPLAAGLADGLKDAGIAVLGPTREAARLESSKAFAKEVMQACGVPTARARRHDRLESALEHVRESPRCVVKADGLAAGKGVVVADDLAEAEAAVRHVFDGAFGRTVALIEERLEGPEVSVIALVDGARCCLLAPAQDHKRALEGDEGPNTGGMGAYSPAPMADAAFLENVRRTCLQPVVDEMSRRGHPFRGVLYAGLMLTDDGPKVLEYNVRFGDPEAQVILPRLADDPLDLMLAAARGELEKETAAVSDEVAATVVLASEGYPGSPTRGDVIEGLEAAARTGVRISCAGVGRRESDGALITDGGRVLAVTGMGATLRNALDVAYEGVGHIRFRGMQYRRDIGWRALSGG